LIEDFVKNSILKGWFMSRSKEYIFQRQGNKITLLGKFEEFYKNVDDPWDQTSNDSEMAEYYKYSRKRLIECILLLNRHNSIIEIGCGLGNVTNIIKSNFEQSSVTGFDISKTAIQKSKLKYNNIEFFIKDIASLNFNYDRYADVVILSQMLWYVLYDIDIVIKNIFSILNKNGFMIIQMAFLNNQNYGTDIIDGFSGLVQYCEDNLNDMFEIVYKDFDNTETYDYNDGIVCLRKKQFIFN
jgi:SAM-dependent methyltransferase